MLFGKLWFSLIFSLNILVNATTLKDINDKSQISLKIWNNLLNLFNIQQKNLHNSQNTEYNDEQILTQLYPVVFQLDTDIVNMDLFDFIESYYEDMAESGNDKSNDNELLSLVDHILKNFYNKPDWAALLKPSVQYSIDYMTNTTPQNYFILNGGKFYKPDDIFYLKSNDLKKQSTLQDSHFIKTNQDFIIGNNSDAPIIEFFGCPLNLIDQFDAAHEYVNDFDEFNRNIIRETFESSKIRFIYTSNCLKSIPEVVINDQDTIDIGLTRFNDTSDWSFLKDKFGFDENSKIFQFNNTHPLSLNKLNDVSVKMASLIANKFKKNKNFDSMISYFTKLSNNFPLLINYLINNKIKINDILKSNDIFKQNGIDYHLLGLFINGQNIKLSSLNNLSLTTSINFEYNKLTKLCSLLNEKFTDTKKNIKSAKKLLYTFIGASLPNIQELQPVKVDLHRIKQFSDNIIYFNDIETDYQYRKLSKDIKSFLQESKFGEIPEYKENWNELVFIIDFDNIVEDLDSQDALFGLLKTLEIIENGYPQRIGLLPIVNGGNGPSSLNLIAKKIYHLKKEMELEKLTDFLKELGSGEKVNVNDFDPGLKLPKITKLLKMLDIKKSNDSTKISPHIGINGEIYPFKKNMWHYLVAKIIKKDTENLKLIITNQLKTKDKKELSKIKVRDILHLKSFILRNSKYIPDYFSSAIYTVVNNNVLAKFNKRIVEFAMNSDYNILHTVTLYDDFNTLNALKRLKRLQATKFAGVRIRIFHNGDLSNNIWKKLVTALEDLNNLNTNLTGLIKNAENDNKVNEFATESHIRQLDLISWLPDVPIEYFNSNSFMLINGRLIHFEPDEIPWKTQFDAIIMREGKRTLDTMFSLENVFPSSFNDYIDPDFVEMVSSILTKLFYHGAQYYGDGLQYTTETTISRTQMDELFQVNNVTTFKMDNDNEKLIDVTLILDPVEERTQYILSFLPILRSFNFINIEVLLLPAEDINFVPNDRVFLNSVHSSEIQELLENFDLELNLPPHFVLEDNDKFKSVLVEAHVFDKDDVIEEGSINGIGGINLGVVDYNDEIIANFTSMETYGYGQFYLNDLNQNYSIVSLDPNYKVHSISSNLFSDYVASQTFTVDNLKPVRLIIKLERAFDLVKDYEKGQDDKKKQDSINIFSVLLNHDDAEINAYKDMVIKLSLSNKQKITFWLFEDSALPRCIKDFVTAFNANNNFNANIKLVRYEWPNWLRPQRYYSRKLDASRILFLDVMFPSYVDKIIYMTPTSTPIDPEGLLTLKTKQAFSLFKMDGSGYWDEGYWEKNLKSKGGEFFSVEPLMLIDLKIMRDRHINDEMRIHYQRLTVNSDSLVNISQDLLNDLQTRIPITKIKKTLQKRTVNFASATMNKALAEVDKEVAKIQQQRSERETSSQGVFDENSDFSENNEFDVHDEL